MISYTPLRYPGGKGKLYPFVKKIIENNYENKPAYAEPYAGGFGLGMKLLINEKVSRVYINDLDFSIYVFWKEIIENTENFIEKIINTNIDINEWKKQKEIYHNPNVSYLEKGFATFFLNRTNRSGIMSAGPIGGYNQNGNYKIDCRFNKKNLVDLIRKISELKDKIFISNMDGKDFLKYVDKLENNVLIYLDPPYVEKGKDLYINSFTKKDHTDLSKVIKDLKNNWFLTYDDNPLIEELYKDIGIEKFDIKYSVQTKRTAKEIIVFSPKLKVEDKKK
ncbi:MAG: DNA adenine methylase [Bacilli bacterium]|jgi:DNA adenine methylase|nr:DNA adenine methylase [Bacilli bacterium]